LKTEGSSGGTGVRIAYNAADARVAFRWLARRGMIRALKDLVINSDFTTLETSLRRDRPRITIQPFIPGRSANAAVACYRGKLLAHVCVEVLASDSLTGPSTIIQVIDHPGMSAAVEKMVQALKLSGLCGFDFILDDNDKPYLIDFNPHATQTSHLVSHDGRQPVAWLIEHLRGYEPAAVMRPNLDPIVLSSRFFPEL
jgi:predicted ATP-grasp superfamily ATP-dependent carboligase